jgi:DNA-binding beta-propeller fold protein YncE
VIGVVALTAPAPAGAQAELTLALLDRFETGKFDEGGSEIPAFDPKSQRFFVTNGAESAVDVLELQGGKLVRVAKIRVPAVTSVAVSPKGGLLAVAVPAANETDPGQVRT